VELNPEELLLCLLKSYGKRDSTETLLAKWEQILTKHPDSCKLSCENSICFCAKGNSPHSKFLKFGSPTCMLYRLYLQLAPSYVGMFNFNVSVNYFVRFPYPYKL
jgi:hypothetical protein